jgi:hypothetical protein
MMTESCHHTTHPQTVLFFHNFSGSGEGSDKIPSLHHSLEQSGVVVSVFGSALPAIQLIGAARY